jgi:hypothetical protein
MNPMNQVNQTNQTRGSIFLLSIFLLFSFTSCSDLLDTESNRVLSADKNTLQSANDSLYSMLGIWGLMTTLGERYVLLGELRGELMDVTVRADADLRAIADFDYSQTPENKYTTQIEYYTIINNCNYFIQHADTTPRTGLESTLKKEWIAIKAYRAWVYMQLALNYGEAVYLEQPLLTVDEVDAAARLEPIGRNEIFSRLIADLEPYIAWEQESDYPVYSDEMKDLTTSFFFRISHLLGDLYLWTGEYEKAAQRYYALMVRLDLVPWAMTRYADKDFGTTNIYRTYWARGGEWPDVFKFFGRPNITALVRSTELTTMTDFNERDASFYKVAPSQAAIDLWNNTSMQVFRDGEKPPYPIYYYKGDLRGEQRSTMFGSYRYTSLGGDTEFPYIVKYSSGGAYVYLLRTSTLCLRYAEALNNLGKPASAFTVLKYGVDELADPAKNSRIEEVTPLPAFCNFSWIPEDDRQYVEGIHAYGCGYLEHDTVYYVFPDSATIAAIPEASRDEYLRRFVEEKLLDEYGLETAFEGNRFHDLMRFALRNNNNTLLANRVARRNPALQSRLLNEKNWYLPKN